MRPNRRRGNPGFETLLVGFGVVIVAGQSLVAVVADYLPAFVTLAVAIGAAAVIVSAALRRLEQRGAALPDVAEPVPLGRDANRMTGVPDMVALALSQERVSSSRLRPGRRAIPPGPSARARRPGPLVSR